MARGLGDLVATNLDERKFESEIQARSRELNLREREVALQEKNSRHSLLNPAVLGLFAAALGLLGNAVVAFYNSRASMELERFRSQSSLVVEAIKTGDPKSACKNLEFLAEIKRIDNPEETKNQCAKLHPYLPPASATDTTLGSCNMRDPNTTMNSCFRTGQAACASLGGVWVSGSECN